jgi:hypothetical protein
MFPACCIHFKRIRFNHPNNTRWRVKMIDQSLTSRISSLLQNSLVVKLLKNFPTFCKTRRFITVFIRALYLVLSWARSIESVLPPHIRLRFILILIHKSTSSSSELFLSFWLSRRYPTCIPFTPIRDTCPAHLILLDLIIPIILGEENNLWSPSLCSFLQTLITSFLFGPNIFWAH